MATIERISIALTQEMAAVVREAVESGEYASNSEVIRDALRDWKLKRTLQQQQIDELRRLWRRVFGAGRPAHSICRPLSRKPAGVSRPSKISPPHEPSVRYTPGARGSAVDLVVYRGR